MGFTVIIQGRTAPGHTAAAVPASPSTHLAPAPEELPQAYTTEYVNRTRRLGLPRQPILETITRALSQ